MLVVLRQFGDAEALLLAELYGFHVISSLVGPRKMVPTAWRQAMVEHVRRQRRCDE
jgi:hypothetical protein